MRAAQQQFALLKVGAATAAMASAFTMGQRAPGGRAGALATLLAMVLLITGDATEGVCMLVNVNEAESLLLTMHKLFKTGGFIFINY